MARQGDSRTPVAVRVRCSLNRPPRTTIYSGLVVRGSAGLERRRYAHLGDVHRRPGCTVTQIVAVDCPALYVTVIILAP
jgi:hypothetical protein